MLSSKGDAKQEARFAARLDVLMERIDTLASTVATTASSIAKKDGEIAALRRDLDARDQAVQALVEEARRSEPAPGAPALDPNEIRSLRNAVAGLKERVENGSAAQVEELATRMRDLDRRVGELSESEPAALAGEAESGAQARIDALESELAELRASLERRPAEPERPSEELVSMLATLRSQVEALGGLRAGGVDGPEVDRRFGETDEAVAVLGQRLDTLGETVESAASSLSDKEHELAALHRHFTESSTRIESIVDDIREALHAFPELESTSLGALVARVERVETAAREAAETTDRRGTELARKIDRIDERVASVAAEVERAKTLWPIALRSLEARLEDVAHARRAPDADEQSSAPVDGDPPDDLLAGLRDSLQAMESVAAEMARASETLSEPFDEEDVVEEPEVHTEEPAEHHAAAAGATIVPLRASEP
ncbi:MAG TPA: hypothetical protein VEW90_00980 [Gaiellaceae bacterium]|nr:hypothetical protein [Gaiellaceae bacterium]